MMVTEVVSSVPKGVVLPDSIWRQTWEFIALVLLVISLFMVPYQISFSDKGVDKMQFLLDLVIDLFFAADIIARITKFAVIKDGFLVSVPSEFRKIYIRGEFPADLFSSMPVSFFVYLIGTKNHYYGISRLVQITRIRRFGKYLSNFIEAVTSRSKIVVSTGSLRIFQIGFFVVCLCHWFACAYHYIGTKSDTSYNWIVVDDSIGTTMGLRYLRSFYWALYTGKLLCAINSHRLGHFHFHGFYLCVICSFFSVTTIGYGAIPVVTNSERVFAMIAMAIGAVICDAGITAVLTSIISNKDHQAGTNNRRVQCSKRFMISNCLTTDLQNRVLDFYSYADGELQNICENEILGDLSTSLKNEVLAYFCFGPLKTSHMLRGFSEGAIVTLVNGMTSYLAIPGEKLSEIGKPCSAIYILQRGSVQNVDTFGIKYYCVPGTLIGHDENMARTFIEGHVRKSLKLQILSAQGIKTKYGNPYVEIEVGSRKCRGIVQKTKTWEETINMKISGGNSNNLRITIKEWRKNNTHTLVGTAQIQIIQERLEGTKVKLQDSQGRQNGILICSISCNEISEENRHQCQEETSEAMSYCHLYKINKFQIQKLKGYLNLANNPDVPNRLETAYLEQDRYHQRDVNGNDTRKVERQFESEGMSSDSSKRKKIDDYDHSLSELNGSTICRTKDIENGILPTENQNDAPTESKSWSLIDRLKGSATIVPIQSDHPTHPIHENLNLSKDDDLSPASCKNNYLFSKKGQHLSLEENQVTANKSHTNNSIPSFESFEENDDWNKLVDFSSYIENKSTSTVKARRASFFIEWATNGMNDDYG